MGICGSKTAGYAFVKYRTCTKIALDSKLSHCHIESHGLSRGVNLQQQGPEEVRRTDSTPHCRNSLWNGHSGSDQSSWQSLVPPSISRGLGKSQCSACALRRYSDELTQAAAPAIAELVTCSIRVVGHSPLTAAGYCRQNCQSQSTCLRGRQLLSIVARAFSQAAVADHRTNGVMSAFTRACQELHFTANSALALTTKGFL